MTHRTMLVGVQLREFAARVSASLWNKYMETGVLDPDLAREILVSLADLELEPHLHSMKDLDEGDEQ